MKVRVCPNCGKQNSENTFNCIDCGTTLSIKTLIDTDELQGNSVAGKGVLSNIPPYLSEEVAEIIKTVKEGYEDILLGSNITQVAGKAPFRFGFLILTTQRLVCEYFESDIDVAHRVPSRTYHDLSDQAKGAALHIMVGPVLGMFAPKLIAVDNPSYALSQKEKSSRVITDYKLKDLVKADLSKKWYGEILLADLDTKFQQGDQMTFTFSLPDDADKTYKILSTRLKK